MTEIPKDIMEAAAACAASCSFGGQVSNTLLIAKFLMARDERAAKIADNYECGPLTGENKDGETHYQNGAIDAATGIATAIRTQQEK